MTAEPLYLLHDLRSHPTRCADKCVSDIFTGVVLSGRKPGADAKVGDHHAAFLSEQNVSCFYISEYPNQTDKKLKSLYI